MIAGIADLLGQDRRYFLFDSFEGLPPAKEIDGAAALNWQANKDGPEYHDNCTAAQETARRAMVISRAKRFEIVKGWFDQTLAGFDPGEPIAILRLDADWFDSTMACLNGLYRYMASDGVILVDDYYAWDGCSKAVHKFLGDGQCTDRIFNFGGVCSISKGPMSD